MTTAGPSMGAKEAMSEEQQAAASPWRYFHLTNRLTLLSFNYHAWRVDRSRIESPKEAVLRAMKETGSIACSYEVEEVEGDGCNGNYETKQDVWETFREDIAVTHRLKLAAALLLGTGIAAMWPEHQAAIAQGKAFALDMSASTPFAWGAKGAVMAWAASYGVRQYAFGQLLKKSQKVPEYKITMSAPHDYTLM